MIRRVLLLAVLLIGIFMAKPYSFQYPSDVQIALSPWRKYLSEVTGGNSFDSVMSMLSDRDRALEDHLNLTIGQGYLGVAYATNATDALTGVSTNIPGLTVTVTVPPGRQLKLTAYSLVEVSSGTPSSFIGLAEDGVVLVQGYHNHQSASDGYWYSTVTFHTPTAGEHVYTTRGSVLVGGANHISQAGARSFLSVEDVGPAFR